MASQWPPKKNTAFTLYFTLYKSDGSVIANPGTITKKVSIDGGAVADIAAAVTEEDTTYGQCSLVIAAAEMNGDAIWIQVKDDTTGCVPYTVTLYTAAQTLDEVEALVDDLEGRLTATRAGYLDALNTGVPLAANQDVRNVSGTLPDVQLAATQDHITPYSGTPPTVANIWDYALASMGAETTVGGRIKAFITSLVYEAPPAAAPTAGDIKTALEATPGTLATLLTRIVGTLLAGNHTPQSGDGYAAVGALNDFDPVTDVVAHVTLVDTTTTNTDMRGTDIHYVPPA